MSELPAADALRAYLPRCLLRLLQQQKTRLRSHAAALFVDISGFTAMTEAFAARGNAGAEELTASINRFFTALVAVVDEYGGDIVAFGGDAMAVAFIGPPARANALVSRAHACALALQHAAQQSAQIPTSLGHFTLSIKMGLAYGRFVGEIIRASPTQARFLAHGPALQFAGDTEHTAPTGQVALHASITPFKHHPQLTRPPHPPIPLSPHPVNLNDYVAFLPPALVTRLLSGQAAFVNEHRHISIMFVGVDRAIDLPTVMAQIEQWGGAIARLDSGDKGLRVLALFGAPITYEDNAARATRCALALHAALGAHIRIGLSSGYVFCGEVGAPSRHEYTVMGDAVNVAARLMQAAAWGETLATDSTRSAASIHAHWQTRPALALKGKTEPVPVFVPLPIEAVNSIAPFDQQPMQGRTREIARVAMLLDGLADGQRAVTAFALHIVAEAGMGKSLLAAHVAAQAQQRGDAVASAAGQPYGQAAFQVWRQLLTLLMRLPSNVENVGEHARQWLAEFAPQLQSRWPLLAQVFGWAAPTEIWLGQIDVETRTQLLHETVTELLRAWSQQHIGVLIIDDAHWLDTASRDLLAYVVAHRGDATWGCFLFSRPEPAPMADSALIPQMTLGEIDESEAFELAQRVWSDAAVGAGLAPAPKTMSATNFAVNIGTGAGASPAPTTMDAILRDIVQRGQGNPFFIEQLVRLAKQSLTGDTSSMLALPTSLRNLWLHRIDQLPIEAQAVLKLASVIGPSFGVAWLRACWPGDQAIHADAIAAQLAHLTELDYLRVSTAPFEVTHLFRHATLREAAYDTLSFANREALHEQVGFFIEQHFAAQRSDLIDTLAHHFGLSKNVGKQRVVFREAGDAAGKRYANDVALTYYERLLPLLSSDAQEPVLRQMGEVETHVGRWSQAEAHLQAALHIASVNSLRLEEAQAQAALGRLLARSQSYGESAKWLAQAGALFESLGDPTSLCNVLTHLGFAQMELGELAAAEATAQRQWQLAQSINDPAGMAEAQQTLGQLATQRSDWPTAQAHLEQALALAENQLDPRRTMLIENDVATLAWRMGNYQAAFQHFVAALQSADQIGFRTWVGVLLGNIGVLFWELGLLNRAEALLAAALKIATDLGDQTSILTCLGNTASLLRDQGHVASARAMLARAVQLGQDLQMPYYLCDHAELAAELAFEDGDVDAAETMNTLALDAAENAADGDVAFRARVLGLRIALQQRQRSLDDAVAQLQSWLNDEANDEHIAFLRDHIAQLTQRDRERDAAVLAYTMLHQAIPKLQYRRRVQVLSNSPTPLPIPAWVHTLQAQPLPELTTIVVPVFFH